jgi:tetratricopeptide (TPR) repeat protein
MPHGGASTALPAPARADAYPETLPSAAALDEALAVLELIERGDVDAAGEALSRASSRSSGCRASELVWDLLEAWIERHRAGEVSPRASPASEHAAALKEEGLLLYGSGDLDRAIDRWRRASDLAPEDRETRAWLRRALRIRNRAEQ